MHRGQSLAWDGSGAGVVAKGRDLRGGPRGGSIRRLGEVADAVGGGYCRLQMRLELALAARETVAGHRLGALKWGRGEVLEGGEGGGGRGGPGTQKVGCTHPTVVGAAAPSAQVAGLLRKKCMPATVSNANIRSLNFLVWYWSKQAGKRSSNSLAFSTDDSRLLNKLAIRYAHAADEAATIPKSTVLRMEEDAASLVCQRCRGSSELFVAVTQTQFLKDYAQARKQELEQVKEEEHQKSALGDTREAKRRAGIIDQLFMKLDFNCSGYIEFHELQQVWPPPPRDPMEGAARARPPAPPRGRSTAAPPPRPDGSDSPDSYRGQRR